MSRSLEIEAHGSILEFLDDTEHGSILKRHRLAGAELSHGFRKRDPMRTVGSNKEDFNPVCKESCSEYFAFVDHKKIARREEIAELEKSSVLHLVRCAIYT